MKRATPAAGVPAGPARAQARSRFFQRHIVLPAEHGAWVFLFSPLAIGLAAGGRFTANSALLVLTALAAFLLRQPVTMAVKALTGRRARSELSPALVWVSVYGAAALAGVATLAARGYAYVLWLAVPAVPVLGWHLWLVARRAERRQIEVEIAGSGALALAAPAAFWVGQGQYDPTGWLLWGLCWLQTAGSILYAYLRLEQRRLNAWPEVEERLKMGGKVLLYNHFIMILVLILSGAGITPPWLPAAFAVQAAETWWGTLRPAVGVRPNRIGIRQLAVSSLFTVIFILSFA